MGTKAGGVDPNTPNYLKEITRRKARQIITAGGKDQIVLDGGPYGHSVFTGSILEAIKEGLADFNGDGYITYAELVSYLVPAATNPYQTPAPAYLPGHGSGEFVFRSPKGATKAIVEKPVPDETVPRGEQEASISQPPFSFRKQFTNSIGMKFVLIQPGSFYMGSQLSPVEAARRYGGEAKWLRKEKPAHHFKIKKPFYIQTTEITQGQWKRIMGDNPSYHKDCGNDCPVETVSWNDAQEYIKKLNQMEDTGKYRLPTEAEWEYACRAGTTTEFSFGNELDKLSEYAWYWDNAGKSHPVGKKKPNAWGLYDMHGNVVEMCQNSYVTDRPKVTRGGSYILQAGYLRSAARYESAELDFRGQQHGFRVARDF
jgi:formylglycine-generating enzyme required for sulfatase activity